MKPDPRIGNQIKDPKNCFQATYTQTFKLKIFFSLTTNAYSFFEDSFSSRIRIISYIQEKHVNFYEKLLEYKEIFVIFLKKLKNYT